MTTREVLVAASCANCGHEYGAHGRCDCDSCRPDDVRRWDCLICGCGFFIFPAAIAAQPDAEVGDA